MKKNIISIVTASVMAAVSVPNVFASDADYTQLLLDVKNKLQIPQEYTEFENNNKYEDEDGMVYSFTWTNKDEDEYNTISVTCRDTGFITRYNNSKKTSGDYEALNMDDEKARDAALEFVLHANPELDGVVSLDRKLGYSFGGMSYDIVGTFYDVEYYQSIGRVTINSDYTVTSMNVTMPDIAEPANDTVYIDNETGYKNYMDKIGVDTFYRTYRDDDRKLCVFPVYQRKNNKGIDAITGEVMDYNNQFDKEYGENASTGSSGGGASSDLENYKQLNESELAQLAELNNLITKADAVNIVKERTGISIEPKNTNLYKDIDGVYTYSFNNGNISVSMNASNGDITGLYITINPGQTDNTVFKNYNLDDKDEAEELLKKLAPNDGALYTYDEDGLNYDIRPYNVGSNAEDIKEETHNAGFEYKVNDIPVYGVAASISSHKYNDVISYGVSIQNLTAYKSLEYPKPETFKAVEDVFNDISFTELRYVETKDGAKAAYITEPFMKNAVTGIEVNYRNEENKEAAEYIYTDIDNHWVKDTAQKLGYIGVGFDGEKLMPEADITVSETEELLNRVFYIPEDERTESGETVTRRMAAETVAKAMGLEKLMEMDIYAQPYTDVTEDFGAIALMKGYGVFASDTDTFRPDDNVTRAEFMQIIYNVLMSDR